ANIVRAIDLVAARLGNTRAVCRHYYVHPGVLEAYQAGRVAPTPSGGGTKRRRKRPGLRKDEIAVLELLQLENSSGKSGVKKRPRKSKQRVS
ncbi:MAG: DNA topoisomerase IB, partial [Gemmatimonadota bacterium]|nr:DNA topoisomerase IB [Gemmatimonadota bacterium]